MIRFFSRFLFLAFALSAASSLQAQDDESVFASANRDFEAGDFEAAALKYLSLVEKGRVSPELYYNLGTARYREGKPGEAMLWLRRASVVDPGMPEASQNMEFLRERLAFLEFADSRLDAALRALPPTFGKWLWTVALWVALIALAAAFCLRRLHPNRSGLVTFAVVAGMIAVVGTRISSYRRDHLALENFATVTESDTSALTAPAPAAKSVIDLPPGSEVRILQETGNWRYADIPGDVRGWVRAEKLEPVWPVSRSSR
ncbi:MAG: hypothetical protein WD342_15455 [Verrucomicrobiales bacterium]